MEELLKKIMLQLENVESKIDRIQLTLDSYHIENIESNNRLLAAIHTTNDRLDFQRDKISKTEEDLYLLKQKH
ncbi:hypothetical protein LJR153_006070 [Paenibacillus sp. LjRoot153]|uniref:hypothetical protein n=1 Tax=Paenibacillus sp. LjRoot153 TaxID=3342270 RepID=UPI003ECE53AB